MMARTVVEAPMQAAVKRVDVTAGDQVKENCLLCMLESMKMMIPIVAPVAGKVVEVNVIAGGSVKEGSTMIVIEAEDVDMNSTTHENLPGIVVGGFQNQPA